LATVHWVAKYEGAGEVKDLMSKVYGWNAHKRMFKEQHIQLAWELLQQQGWVGEYKNAEAIS
jgi:hypothetical protein